MNGAGTTFADGGEWWGYDTLALPGAFAKLEPSDGSADSGHERKADVGDERRCHGILLLRQVPTKPIAMLP